MAASCLRPTKIRFRYSERTHLTLKKEAIRPTGMNFRQQQARFDDCVAEFNSERRHEALGMKCPAEVYALSSKAYSGLPDLTYPLPDREVLVTHCGRICMHRKRGNISTVCRSAAWTPGGRRRHLDRELHARRSRLHRSGAENLATTDNPFGAALQPMSPVRSVTYDYTLPGVMRSRAMTERY
jgi:hypothetical protein